MKGVGTGLSPITDHGLISRSPGFHASWWISRQALGECPPDTTASPTQNLERIGEDGNTKDIGIETGIGAQAGKEDLKGGGMRNGAEVAKDMAGADLL